MFNNIPTVFVCPKELEFNSKNVTGIYLGNSINKRNLTNEWKIVHDNNCELIYISFGTINFHKTSIIEEFLDSINSILTKKTNIYAILSCGLNNTLFKKNQNRWNKLKLFTFVDQHEILCHCDYFISHGGLNSIKESIHYQVPMLIYPLEGDQIGNAQKMDFLELGIAGNIYKDNLTKIGYQLDLLISNKKKYKSNLKKFNADVIQNYNIDNILRASIKNYIKIE